MKKPVCLVVGLEPELVAVSVNDSRGKATTPYCAHELDLRPYSDRPWWSH